MTNHHSMHGTPPTPPPTSSTTGTTTSTPAPGRRAYVTQVTTVPSPPVPGRPVTLSIRVLGPDGRPVTRFDSLHTKKMHLIAVSGDLREFQHLHPTLARDGTLTVRTTFPRAVPYDLVMEFDPAGPVGAITTRVDLRSAGARPLAAALRDELRADTRAGYTKVVGQTRVTLDTNAIRLRAGQPAHLSFTLLDNRTGQPVPDLKDWLGMPGHAIVFSEDRHDFQHLHGHVMGPGPMAGGGGGGGGHGGHTGPAGGTTTAGPRGNVVGFPANFPRPGIYKVFAQFQRGRQVLTASFVVDVA